MSANIKNNTIDKMEDLLLRHRNLMAQMHGGDENPEPAAAYIDPISDAAYTIKNDIAAMTNNAKSVEARFYSETPEKLMTDLVNPAARGKSNAAGLPCPAEPFDLAQTLKIRNPIEADGESKEAQKSGAIRRIWNSSVTGCLFYGLMALLVFLVFLFKGSGAGSGTPHSLFGFSGLTVLTTSMQSEIPQGSFVLIRHMDPNDLQIGDDVTYFRAKDVTYTHRIVAIYEGFAGTEKRGFQTKGVNNPSPDQEIVMADNVVGKVIFHSYRLGRFFTFVQSNLILCGAIGIMLIGFLTALRMFLTPKRKDEKEEDVNPASAKARSDCKLCVG